jgi:two-component system, OmpR family, response regulator QseB
MRVLLVANDVLLADALRERLGREGYTVDWHTGLDPEVLSSQSARYGAFILDIAAIREEVGFTLRRLRQANDKVLAIVIGADASTAEKIRAFDCGADEYLVRPVVADELAARLRALLRRISGAARGELIVGDVHLNPVRRLVARGGRDIPLTAREYVVLAVLMSTPGRLVTRVELERQLYGFGEEIGSNSVEVHIHNLRRKLGGPFIRNVRGRGYCVEPAGSSMDG